MNVEYEWMNMIHKLGKLFRMFRHGYSEIVTPGSRGQGDSQCTTRFGPHFHRNLGCGVQLLDLYDSRNLTVTLYVLGCQCKKACRGFSSKGYWAA